MESVDTPALQTEVLSHPKGKVSITCCSGARRGRIGFSRQRLHPCGLEGREAGKMLPEHGKWDSGGIAEPQLLSRSEPFAGPPARGAACAWGRLVPAGAGAAGTAGMALCSAAAGREAGGAPGYGQSFRNCAFIFSASKSESARGGVMTHGTPEIIFMGIDP